MLYWVFEMRKGVNLQGCKLGYTQYYIQMQDDYLFRPHDDGFYDICAIKTKISNTIPKQDWG